MRAVLIEEPGDEDVLRVGETEAPSLAPDQVRIRVAATAVNRADLLQRRGLYPPPPGASEILGLECSGRIAEVGSAASGWAIGDRVMALLPGGGYAEEVVVHAGSVLPVPDGLDLVEAAGLPEVYLTVFANVFMTAAAKSGEALLVHGGGSGIGTASIQLAREAGLDVFVTAGSAAKCERCESMGARAINYREDDFAARLQEWTERRGVDVILDSIGGSYLESNLKSLAMGGRLVIIGLTGGARAEINLGSLMLKRQQVIGSTLRARPDAEKAEITSAFQARFGEAIAAGRIGVVVETVLPLEAAPDAHRMVEASSHFGKVILRVSAD